MGTCCNSFLRANTQKTNTKFWFWFGFGHDLARPCLRLWCIYFWLNVAKMHFLARFFDSGCILLIFWQICGRNSEKHLTHQVGLYWPCYRFISQKVGFGPSWSIKSIWAKNALSRHVDFLSKRNTKNWYMCAFGLSNIFHHSYHACWKGDSSSQAHTHRTWRSWKKQPH